MGSICLYDLTDFESAVKRDFFDYRLQLAAVNPTLVDAGEPLKIQEAIKEISNKYTVLSHTF